MASVPASPAPFPRAAFLARFLQADQPVPARPEAEVMAEVWRNYPWNFVMNLLDGAFYWFGATFASGATILPLFVSKLTASPVPIGLLAAINQGSWYLPQIFTANVVERLPRKKPVVVNLGFFVERLPVWLLVAAALVAEGWPEVALGILLVGCAVWGLGAGLVATSWQELIARCFPVERRGRFFGLSSFVGAGAGTIGASLSAWLLQAWPFPMNFAWIFGIAAGSITLSWGFLTLVREPVQAVTVPSRSNREYLAGLPALLRHDRNFRWFLLARLLLTLGSMATGFLTVAAVQRWHVADGTVGIYTMIMFLGLTGSSPAFGFLADRLGHKLSLEIGALASFLSFGLAWLSPLPEAYYLVFLLVGIGFGSLSVSGILIVLELSVPERRPTYVGIANTGVGMAAVTGPLLATVMAGLGYAWLFATSAALSLAALVLFHWWVEEPRCRAAVGHKVKMQT